jgi:TRAP-type C4-dicarboxylate transport system substrate-binding protein
MRGSGQSGCGRPHEFQPPGTGTRPATHTQVPIEAGGSQQCSVAARETRFGHGLAKLGVAALSLILLTSGCGGSVDKAGGSVPEPTRTLKLLNPRFGAEVEPFVAEVAKLSAGALVVEQEQQFDKGSADNEVDAIKAVQAGRSDLAVVPVRAFGLVGLRSFDALIAPMEVDSMSLQQQVLSSDVAIDMVSGVEGLGLKGIGILPGPMRLPAGITRPLRTPRDFSGARIAFSASAVAERSLRALDAVPVKSGFEHADMSRYDGLEQQIASISGNRYDDEVKWITGNAQLWPRPLAVVATADSFDSLSDAQRAWLTQAIRSAIPSTVALQRDTEDLGAMCRRGKAQMINASSAHLKQLRNGFAPVYQWLRGDASTARYLDQIDALKVGVTADPNDVPDCSRLTQPSAGTPSAPPPASASEAVSAIDGNYLARITKSDLLKAGEQPGDLYVENYGEFRIVFDRGRFAFTQQQSPSCTWGYGTFKVTGNKLQMLFIDGGGKSPNIAYNRPGELYDYTWSTYKGAMKWSPVPGAVSPGGWAQKPWIRHGTAPANKFLSKECPPPAAAFER